MAEDEQLEEQREWLRRFPVRDMEKLGWIDDRTVGRRSALRELLKFFGIPSFGALERRPRRSGCA